MPGQQPPLSSPNRVRQLTTALRLVWVSVVFGLCSGAVSVATGLANHSLSVLAVGLGLLADVTGSPPWPSRPSLRLKLGTPHRQPPS